MKRKNMKVILVVSTLLSALTAQAAKNYDLEVDGLYYKVDTRTKTASVVRGDTHRAGDVRIASSVDYNGITYPVTSIAANCFWCSYDMTSLEIPSSVTSIGNYAFYCCYNMATITLPSTLTSLGTYAFKGCI